MTRSRTDEVDELRLLLVVCLTACAAASTALSRMEGDVGTIAVGRLADLAVLSEDIMRIEPARIRDVRVNPHDCGRPHRERPLAG